MWQGESERAVRTLLDKARKMAPCVVFFDEFDSLGMDRGHVGPGNSGLNSVVNQLLTELDGIDSRDGVLVIAATNRRDLIDSAFLREGRLGSQVEVGLPERREYWQIIDRHLGDSPRSSELDLRPFSDSLPDGMSGADLAGIGKRIREISVRRHLESNPEGKANGFMIKQEDVEAASESALVSVGMEAWT
jgi:transitional endoplasmic reticulum ATPase